DVFVSYASADRRWVEGPLAGALDAAGLRWHSETAFQLGVPRLREFEHAVQHSRRVLLILSPDYLIDDEIQYTESLALAYGVEMHTWPVIPLVLRLVALPPRLAMLQGLDATDRASWLDVLHRLCMQLRQDLPPGAARPRPLP